MSGANNISKEEVTPPSLYFNRRSLMRAGLAAGTAIGTGLANTIAIINVQGNIGGYAAKLCRDYRGGGYTDWYLPSTDELFLLFLNQTIVGGFVRDIYWSSSEAQHPFNPTAADREAEGRRRR